MTNPKISRAIHAALVTGMVASVGGYSLSAAAAEGADQAKNLGQINVVGTRIKRTDVETSQPVLRIDRQKIQQMGVNSVGQLLQHLSSSGAAFNLLTNYAGNFSYTASGNTGIDLRFLGAGRTLVLVNGHRWLTGLSGTMDLSTIPMSIIDHVEVLRDGASAIYGSDAIAGVVNIVTRKSFNGTEASAYYGEYMRDGHHDGKTQKYYFTVGAANDHAGAYLNVGYRKSEPIFAGDRDISSVPIPGTGLTRGSGSIPQGRFRFVPPADSPLASNSALCPVGQQPNFIAPMCDLTLKDGAAGTKISDFRPFKPHEDRFNYAPDNYVLTPQELTSLYVHGHYDFSPSLSFVSELLYARRFSKQQAGPTTGGVSSRKPHLIPGDQAYNPFGFDLSTVAPVPLGYTYNSGPNAGEPVVFPNLLGIGRRMVEAGPRRFSQDVKSFVFRGGFQGNFLMGNTFWNWDAGYTFGHSSQLNQARGRFNSAKLDTSYAAACATAPGCVPFNWFGGQGTDGNGSITQPMLDYTTFTEQNTYSNNLRAYDANISSSDLVQLPAGPLGLALGYAYHEQDGDFIPDSVAHAGNDSFTSEQVPETHGRTSNDAFYGELNIPILSDLPGANMLTLDIAERYSDYDTFGTANTGRAGFKWQPFHDLLIRGTWSQGFRAPTINGLYAGRTRLDEVSSDPCSNYTTSGAPGDVVARCKAAGVPPTYEQGGPQISVTNGGNPNLQPETSISRSVGFVYSPSALPGFNVNLDYYKIDLEDTIQPIDGQSILDYCYRSGQQSACDRITRNFYGQITQILDSSTNIGGTTTDGYDYGISYSFQTGVGDFKASLNGTHIITFDKFIPAPGGGVNVKHFVGVEYGAVAFPHGVPADKASFSLDWAMGNWTANYTAYYIGDMVQQCSDYYDGTADSLTNLGACSNPNFNDNSLSTNHLGSVVYHNVQVGYDFNAINSTVVFGVHNITDKRPPPSVNAALNGFDPTLYGSLVGVFPYLRITTRFN